MKFYIGGDGTPNLTEIKELIKYELIHHREMVYCEMRDCSIEEV